jgi:acetyl-CoA synthetase
MDQDSSIETHVNELVGVFSASDADAAWLLCDRHQPESVAFTLVESDGSRTDLTYGELRERSERFAGVLQGLGVGRGDRVATLMGKSADLVVCPSTS